MLAAPDPPMLERIRHIINEESDHKLTANVKIVKDWFRSQPHLPQHFDERIIPVFLRGCKHDLEKTKKKLDTYFTLRSNIPEFFQQRCPTGWDVVNAFRVMKAFPLPQLTPDGYRITIHQITNLSDCEFIATHIYKALCMIGDIRLIEESAISGDIFIFDVQHVTMSHITRLANPQLRKILHCTQDGYPQRLKEIHLINAPPYIDKIVNMFKMFMKNKMRNRFYIHKKHDTLSNFFPVSILPEDYGGNEPSMNTMQDQWVKKLESYKEWFLKQEKIKTEEELRPAKTTFDYENTQYFGCVGVFKQLSID
uniref:CRAL-TRIO domain-containing protein n=1 Tax=Clastoptera arizonana TaxID=38151 RepID=A0A1B6CMW7_9HEMI